MRRVTPGPGQESVWTYPRPPIVEPVPRRLEVEHAGQLLANAPGGFRVLETSHAPVYYIPPERVRMDLLKPTRKTTKCEFKGTARYFDVVCPDAPAAKAAAWTYADPEPGYEDIKDCISFYAQKLDACYVDRETVKGPPGDSAGWITKSVVGPFNG